MDDGSIVVGTSGGSYHLIGIILRSVSSLTLFSCRPKAAATLGTSDRGAYVVKSCIFPLSIP